ncbi:LOW QUALITY PROTEIN: polyprotein [Phytophthora palmivora]|uniref:Polyprotein n=1 Tax=Phytophthora palmivora TaxID=4796 RepID=A0A2P4XBI7_9STRA|nr:LOW QUALITY PROTEIN: polyprotein [Phytophthora palmivora]
MLIMGSLTTTLAQQLMDQRNGTDMWAELYLTKAQNVYRLQARQDSFAGELRRRGQLYTVFRIKNEMVEIGLPVYYNEPRRKVLFSSNMSKYTPDLVRHLIPTADARQGLGEVTGDASKKKTQKIDVQCYNCGGKGHYISTEVNASKTADHWQKCDVVVVEVVKRVAKDYDPSRWYFDNRINAVTGSHEHLA